MSVPEWSSLLPRYRSHKIVRAATIAGFEKKVGNDEIVRLNLGAERAPMIRLAPSVFARGWPVVGDYIVVYDDGYVSWSPKRAFEEGYDREGG